MTREALLHASVQEFKDNVNNCLLHSIKTLTTKSGYKYLLKTGKSRSISAAIHHNRNFEVEETIGRFSLSDVHINTREELPLGSVLEYKGLLFSIVSMGNYNETMKQYHYDCNSSVNFIQSQFFIKSAAEVNEEIGYNSMSIWLTEDFGITTLPSHYAVDSKTKFIMVQIVSSDNMAPVEQLDSGDLRQLRRDTVQFAFNNMTTAECLKVLKKLQDRSMEPTSPYGLLTLPALADDNFYQKSFNWKSLTHAGSFDCDYYMSCSDESPYKIKEALVTQLQTY